MRGALLSLGLVLLVACGRGESSASTTPTSTGAGAKSPAVTGVTITEEGFDRDEDGSLETRHERNADGSLTIEIDTDGDGKPDLTRRVDALETPEGFVVPEGGIELQEVDPAEAPEAADPSKED